MDNTPYEIERKFLIRRPTESFLETCADRSEITQTYLVGEPGTTERVRRRVWPGRVVYTHTVKKKINPRRRIEIEREIDGTEYKDLLRRADPEKKPIRKERLILVYRGQHFEIDLFPFWERQAYLELELREETQEIEFPPGITILREVTEDRRYTNAALAREIPAEDGEGEQP